MKKAIEQFIEFARGSLATAALNGYKKSTSTISKRLQPIEEDSKEIIYNHYESQSMSHRVYDSQTMTHPHEHES